MLKEIEVIHGEVASKANHYISVPTDGGKGARIVKDNFIRRYEHSFSQQCRVYKNRMISTPFTLYAKIYYTKLSIDLDNSLKTILDCLQYNKCISNDNLCIKIVAEKHLSKDAPRVELCISTQQQSIIF